MGWKSLNFVPVIHEQVANGTKSKTTYVCGGLFESHQIPIILSSSHIRCWAYLVHKRCSYLGALNSHDLSSSMWTFAHDMFRLLPTYHTTWQGYFFMHFLVKNKVLLYFEQSSSWPFSKLLIIWSISLIKISMIMYQFLT